ncbi:Dicer-like protein 1 [Dimargaris verticillata]|uniref:Dicer-like protein 1 n=1 Tax=Dimargaris verticillata TaxID=2761393 RepID=A0A9W8EAQ3_9FUNG|nr:Dicer-like protein 1 [Dimargaris verticillata]
MADPTPATQGPPVARDYQVEVFNAAVARNIIAVLDTGSGKTLIAAMLVRYMRDQQKARLAHAVLNSTLRTARPLQKAVFLLHSVPLVTQQTEAIRTLTGLAVASVHGTSSPALMDEHYWQDLLDSCDVLVITAQVLLDALRHGFVGLAQFHLAVFDECHHARKDHPYNQVMREFYFSLPRTERPKVLGLTASPLCLKASIEVCASTLERNLDCRVFTVHPSMVERIVNRPNEQVVTYSPAPAYQLTELHHRLSVAFNTLPAVRAALNDAAAVCQALGPWCCDAYLTQLASPSSANLSVCTQRGATSLMQGLGQAAQTLFRQLMDACALYQPGHVPPLSPDWLAPKLLMLLKVLGDIRAVDTAIVAMVFVEQRTTAFLIHLLIQLLPGLAFLRSGLLLGHGAPGKDGFACMTHRVQQRMLAAFRGGEFNLLIATGVGEEGLDIQACNLVIRYDLYATVIAYIQSRGRARHANSGFITMVERDNAQHELILRQTAEAEEDMRAWCLQASKSPATCDAASTVADDPAPRQPDYVVHATRARVTLKSAIQLLYRYSNSLYDLIKAREDPTFQIESLAGGFRATVTLSSQAAVRSATGHLMPTKLEARQSAALLACAQLHKARALSDRLLPVTSIRARLADDARLRAQQAVARGEKDRAEALYEDQVDAKLKRKFKNTYTYRKDRAFVWDRLETDPVAPLEPVVRMYATLLWFMPSSDRSAPAVPGYRSWVLLTHCPVPDVGTLSLSHPTVRHAHVHPLEGHAPVLLDSNQRDMLYDFNLKLFSAVLNRRLDCALGNVAYLLAPLIAARPVSPAAAATATPEEVQLDWVDWAQVERVVLNAKMYLEPEDYDPASYPRDTSTGALEADVVLLDSVRYDRKYFLVDIVTDMTPLSPIPPLHTAHLPGEEASTFLDYYQRHHQIHESEALLRNLPMFAVEPVPKLENYQPVGPPELGAHDPGAPGVVVADAAPVPQPAALASATTQYVIPLLCAKHPVSAATYRSALLLPNVLYQLEKALLAWRCRRHLQIECRLDLLTRALVLPLAERSTQGNYERLEYLGDVTLKLMASVTVFVMHPQAHEGQLTEFRYVMINNRRLFQYARQLELNRFVTDAPFTPAKWLPARHVIQELLQRRSARDCHATTGSDPAGVVATCEIYPNKMMADVVEACLGACYLTGGLQCALHAAKQLAIPLPNISQWSDFYVQYRARLAESQAAASAEPASALEYHRLFRQAAKHHVHRAGGHTPEFVAILAQHRQLDVASIEAIIGYRFANPELLVEAFTHPSAAGQAAGGYQRLEFVGDGVVDFLSIKRLYHRFPTATPELLTNMRVASVNNNFLATVCHALGLHKAIIHLSPALADAISAYIQHREARASATITQCISQMLSAPAVASSSGAPGTDGAQSDQDQPVPGRDQVEDEAHFEYWFDLEPPKVLGDVIESLFGAVFVDAQMDIAAAQALYDRLLRPIHDRVISPKLMYIHTVGKLMKFVIGRGCRQFNIANYVDDTPPDAKVAQCTIMVHGHPMLTATHAQFVRARQLAAMQLLAQLRKDPRPLEQRCDCVPRSPKTSGAVPDGASVGGDDDAMVVD